MKYLSVPLGVRRMSDAGGTAFKSRTPSKAQVEKIILRDAGACRCCGFTSKKFQRVIYLRDIDEKAKEDELVTVCTFCEMTANLDRAGLTGAGHLIWLPEMTQADVNNAVRALYVAIESGSDPLAKAARRTLDVLMARRAEAKKRLGTDDPLLLATALQEQVDAKTYAARLKKLEGLRFLPLDRFFALQGGKEVNVFPVMLSYWMSPEGPFGKLPVDQWTKLFEEVSEKAEDKKD